MPAATHLAQLVKRLAQEAGFDRSGIAAVREGLPELAYFEQWIGRGYAGEMDYLKRRSQDGGLERASPARVAPWARSVIVCALNYNSAAPYSTQCSERARGWISRYAWGGREKPADYHDALMGRLRQVEQRLREAAGEDFRSRCYVDTGPVVERAWARYAGVGWIGKNTCVLDPELGSWLFLGVILTSLELEPDVPQPDRCGTCTACIEACPTKALLAPYQLDSNRCISYLTIEKRGNIAEEMRAGMGRHVFGCDICQDVCPWNDRGRSAPPPVCEHQEFQPQPELVDPPLAGLAEMSEDEFRRRFRGSPIRRAKYSGFRRNVAVAMGNSGDRRFVPLLEKMSRDADPVVAEHARWALARLSKAR